MERRQLVANRTHLTGTYAGERVRIEHEHDVLAVTEPGQPDLLAVLVAELELRCGRANLERHRDGR